MIRITDELTRDERFVYEMLESASKNFRVGKNERIGLLVYALSEFRGWNHNRIDDAINGLKNKSRVVGRYSLKKAPPIKPEKPDESRRLAIIDQWKRCVYCRRTLNLANATVDHVVPKSRGGSDEPENLVGCCNDCNQLKGPQTPTEWAKKILDYRSHRRTEPSIWVRYALRCSILVGLLLGR